MPSATTLALRRISRHRGRAFSLLEVMIVLSIMTILAVSAAPTLQRGLNRWRLDAAVRDVVQALSFARAHAVHSGRPVTVCRTGDDVPCSSLAQHCDGDRAAAHDWRCGWSVFVGHRRTLTRASSSSRPIALRHFQAPAGVSVTAHGQTRALTFRPPAGLASGSAGRFALVSGVGRNSTRGCVIVGMNGRWRVDASDCG